MKRKQKRRVFQRLVKDEVRKIETAERKRRQKARKEAAELRAENTLVRSS